MLKCSITCLSNNCLYFLVMCKYQAWLVQRNKERHNENHTTICKWSLTVYFLTCNCFTFQTPGLAGKDYQVWLAIFFLIGQTNNFAPECLASLLLIGKCLAKPRVWKVKEQERMLTVNTSLQMVILYDGFLWHHTQPVSVKSRPQFAD